VASIDTAPQAEWTRRWRSARPFHYAKRTLRIFLLRFTDAYPDAWRADRAPLAGDVERFEALFEGSEVRFEELVTPYREEFRWPIGRIYNGAFQTIDAEIYHSIVRRHRPRHIVEIGSGHSTRFALDALRRNGAGRITCIDPNPWYTLPGAVEHIASKVEDVDLSLFDALEPSDILFIDSSHTTSEARFHAERILPRLRAGVLVQHHDILFPYANPWPDPGAYDEQGVVLDFYLDRPEDWEIGLGSAWLVYRHPHLVRRLIDSYRWAPVILASSLWTQRR
jgi:hypothetical protein